MSSLWKLQSGTKVQKFPFFNALFKSGKLPSKLVHKIIPCPLNGLCNYHDNYSQKMPDSAGQGKVRKGACQSKRLVNTAAY